MEKILEVIDLKKTFIMPYGEHEVLNNVSFALNTGDVCGVIGDSGCGKSTLGKIISGAHHKSGGELYFLGKELKGIKKRSFEVCTYIQYIFQDPYGALEEKYTVKSTLNETIRICKRNKHEHLDIEECIRYVGLNYEEVINKRIGELSGGQRQRICIARAIITKPKLIIADECTAMLDKDTCKVIYDIFRKLNVELETTFFIITHDYRIIKDLCNKVLVLNEGTVAEFDRVEKVIANPQNQYTKEYINAMRLIEGDV